MERQVDVEPTDARDLEDGLRRQNALLLRLAQSEAIDAGELAASLPLLTEVAGEGLECDRASVWLYAADHAAIECVDLFCRPRGEHSRGTVLHARDFPRYFQALAEARTIVASDAHTDPATSEFSAVYLAPLGIGAMLEAPIRRRGRVVGVLCNEHVGPARRFTRDEAGFAASLAEVVSRALDAADRRRAEEALARANAALELRDAENRGLIARLRESVEALSTPVLEVWKDVLAVPVIGTLDERRSAVMTERLLAEVTRTRARQVIVDLTGLEACDVGTAASISRMARAVRLIGAECVFCGMQPAVARDFVELGHDPGEFRMQRSMRDALQAIAGPGRRGVALPRRSDLW